MKFLLFENDNVKCLVQELASLFNIFMSDSRSRVAIERRMKEIVTLSPVHAPEILEGVLSEISNEIRRYKESNGDVAAKTSAYLARIISCTAIGVKKPSAEATRRLCKVLYGLFVNMLKSSSQRHLAYGLHFTRMIIQSESGWVAKIGDYIQTLKDSRRNERLVLGGFLWRFKKTEGLLHDFAESVFTVTELEKVPSGLFVLLGPLFKGLTESELLNTLLPLLNKQVMRNRRIVLITMGRIISSIQVSLGGLIGSLFLGEVLNEIFLVSNRASESETRESCLVILTEVIKNLYQVTDLVTLAELATSRECTYNYQRISACTLIGQFADAREQVPIDVIRNLLSFGYQSTDAMEKEEDCLQCFLLLIKLCKSRDVMNISMKFLTKALQSDNSRYGALVAISELMSAGFDLSEESSGITGNLERIMQKDSIMSRVHIFVLALGLLVSLNINNGRGVVNLQQKEADLLVHVNLVNRLDAYGVVALLKMLRYISKQINVSLFAKNVIPQLLLLKDYKLRKEIYALLGVNVPFLSSIKDKELAVVLRNHSFRTDAHQTTDLLEIFVEASDAEGLLPLFKSVFSSHFADVVALICARTEGPVSSVLKGNADGLLSEVTSVLVHEIEEEMIDSLHRTIVAIFSVLDLNTALRLCPKLIDALINETDIIRSLEQVTGNQSRMFHMSEDAYAEGTKEFAYMVKAKDEVKKNVMLPLQKILGIGGALSKGGSRAVEVLETSFLPFIIDFLTASLAHDLTRDIAVRWIADVVGKRLLCSTHHFTTAIVNMIVSISSFGGRSPEGESIIISLFNLLTVQDSSKEKPSLFLVHFLVRFALNSLTSSKKLKAGRSLKEIVDFAVFWIKEGLACSSTVYFGQSGLSIELLREILKITATLEDLGTFDIEAVLTFCRVVVGYRRIAKEVLPELLASMLGESSALALLSTRVSIDAIKSGANRSEFVRSRSSKEGEGLDEARKCVILNSFDSLVADEAKTLLFLFSEDKKDFDSELQSLSDSDIRMLVFMLGHRSRRTRKNAHSFILKLLALEKSQSQDSKSSKREVVLSSLLQLKQSVGKKRSEDIKIAIMDAVSLTMDFVRDRDTRTLILFNFVFDSLSEQGITSKPRLFEAITDLGRQIINRSSEDVTFLYRSRRRVNQILNERSSDAIYAGYASVGISIVRQYDPVKYERMEAIESENVDFVSMGEFTGTIFNTLFSQSTFVLDMLETKLHSLFESFQMDSTAVLNLFFARLASGDVLERRGAAVGISSFVMGNGVASLDKQKIFPRLIEMASKGPVETRQGALQCLGSVMRLVGPSMKNVLPQMLPILLSSSSDDSLLIREASTGAVRVLMSVMTPEMVEYVEKPLQDYLTSPKWRTKVACLSILKNLAGLSKNSLIILLRNLTTVLFPLLTDPQAAVRKETRIVLLGLDFAFETPILRENFSLIVDALEDPNRYSLKAISLIHRACKEEVFKEERSLHLLFPIIEVGLRSKSPESKVKAAEISSDVAVILNKTRYGTKYSTLFLEILPHLLYDFDPEIRKAAAVSIGKIIRSMGPEKKKKQKALGFSLIRRMTTAISVQDRGGAAQCMAHYIMGMGQEELDSFVQDFEEAMQDRIAKAHSRYTVDENILIEGWLSAIFYLFQYHLDYSNVNVKKHILTLLPLIVRAIGDKSDLVNSVGIRTGSMLAESIMEMKEEKDSFVDVLISSVMDEDWQVRLASLTLIREYMMKLVDSDDVTETAAITKKMRLQILEQKLGSKTRNELVAAICLLRFDISREVAIEALYVWKNLVEDTKKILAILLPVLLDRISFFLDFNLHEFRGKMYTECMGDILSTLDNESFLESLQIFLKEATRNQKGAGRALLGILSAAPYDLISRNLGIFQDYLLTMMTKGDGSEQSIEAFGDVFSALSTKVGSKGTRVVVAHLIPYFKQELSGGKRIAIDNLVQLVRVKSETILPELIPDLLQKPFSIINSGILVDLFEACGEKLSNYVSRTVQIALASCDGHSVGDDRFEAILDLLVAIAGNARGKGVNSLTSEFMNTYSMYPLPLLRTLISQSVLIFAKKNDEVGNGKFLLDVILLTARFLVDSELAITSTGLEILKALLSRVPSEDVYSFIPKLRRSLEYELSIAQKRESINGKAFMRFKPGADLSPVKSLLFGAMRVGDNIFECSQALKLLVDSLGDDTFESEALSLLGGIMKDFSVIDNKDAKVVLIESIQSLMKRSRSLRVDLSVFQYNIKKELLYNIRDDNEDVQRASTTALIELLKAYTDEKKKILLMKDALGLLQDEGSRIRGAALLLLKDLVAGDLGIMPTENINNLEDHLKRGLLIESETNLLLTVDLLSNLLSKHTADVFANEFKKLVYVEADILLENSRLDVYYAKYILLQFLIRRRKFESYEDVEEMILSGLRCENFKLVILSISMFTLLHDRQVDVDYNSMVREIARHSNAVGELKRIALAALNRYAKY